MNLRFARHYLEMVVAMMVGMLVFGAVLGAVLGAVGLDYSHAEHPAIGSLEMAFTMSLGMVAWMRYRGHGWAPTLEMAAAMFAPLAVLLPLLWTGAVSGDSVMMLLHVLMLPAMLAAMLRRRDEYSAAHGRGERVVRVLGRAAAVLAAFLLVPAAVYAVGANAYEASRYTQPEATGAAASAVAAATPPAHDPRKPTAVIVVGNGGANIADTLVPFEVLSSTGAFNVYTVAPERRPLPLLGGLDLVPDLGFAQLDQRLGGKAPDVTVVPDMPEDDAADAKVTAWLRGRASDGLLLGVCTGARLLAEAGVLDGRDATSHWYRLPKLEEDHPEVKWRRGTRYLDDGDVITTGGLLSSVDGTLRAVERLVNADAAAAAARAVGWRHYSPGKPASLPAAELTPSNAIVHLLNLGYRSSGTTVGVLLTGGVGEIELAAAFDPYAEVKSARTLAIAADDGSVRSRHGLTFIPRDDLDAMGRVDRLVVPGAGAAARPDARIAAAARRADVPVDYLHERPGFGFDAALRGMARTMDVPTAEWTGKILEYPTAGLGLSGPAWPWTLALRPLLLGLAGLAVALVAARLVRRARARRS
ncbi:hypothetical protein GCM10010191_05420 [Actinomadura vinacea]|uniref:DJ-1/PfpI domain-containing protein n=1 Tax=Actinomadura vinacea TaxID=115336 RepID=A0ABN3IEL0_9ACTN